tara:strand:- start:30 stop:470 length:441 start_codon:yes stop_codon:yes gene_type:complete
MLINLYSKKFFKILSFPIFLYLIFFNIAIFNKELKANKKLEAATEADLFLYRQMGASYLCIATNAEVDFEKGLGIASATFANVIIGKHEGLIKQFGTEKLDQKRLYNAGTFQIVSSALNICPDNIPKEVKNSYEERLKELIKQNKK